MRSLLSLSVLPLLASASPLFNIGTIHKDAAPILSSMNAEEVPDSYIVVFKDHVTESSAQKHHTWIQDLHASSEGGKMELRKRSQFPFVSDVFAGLKHTYNIAGGLMGYSGHFDEDVIEEVRRHPDVKFIEKDSIVHTQKDPKPVTENGAPWGLARISHRKSLSFGTFSSYIYAADGGEGVDVYIIDTGCNVDHTDFGGRAHWGKTIPTGEEDEDANGHGTHCSGTVAGTTYGVAKKAEIYAIKVLGSNGSGTMSDVVKGVEWAAGRHVEQMKAAKDGKGKKGFKGSSANMSLGGGKSPALDLAVNAAVKLGIHFAVAAGNDNADSCNYSPASAERAVTVGASTLADERAYFSNFGACNDIFAPGLNIKSTWIGGVNATNVISGTSMASPHIAGLLAYYLSLQPAKESAYSVPDITPEQLKKSIMTIATLGALSDVPKDTLNILAWNGAGSNNFTDIMEQGGYEVKTEKKEDLLEVIEDEVAAKSEALLEEYESLVEKVKGKSTRVIDIKIYADEAEELKDILAEMAEDMASPFLELRG